MIAFAVAVSDPETYARGAVPGLRRVIEEGAPVAELTADGGSLHACYDEALEHFAGLDDLEALVFLHQDAELLDHDFCDRVRAELADPEVAVCGAVGARDVTSLAWWDGEVVGRVTETRGEVTGAQAPADADAVDGLLMVLSPWAVRELRFTHEGAAGFDGYDVDLCFQARAAGRRVRVMDTAVHHHCREDRVVDEGWHAADGAFRERWGTTPPPTTPGRPRAAGAHTVDDVVAGYYDNVRPEMLERIPLSARTFLDIGCGSGGLGAAVAARQGARTIGIEVVPEIAAIARTRLDEVIEDDLDEIVALPVERGALDAVVLGDVLEHLNDPARVLKLVREHLSPQGVVIISIPNIGHWSVVGPLLGHDRFTYEQAGLLDKSHVHFFTRHEALVMLDEVGLVPTEIGASVLPLAAGCEPLVDAAVALGADRVQAEQRLSVYQYLITARRR